MQLYCHISRILRCTLVAFAIQSLSPAIAAAQTLAPLVIQGGTLIDATGRDPIEDAVIEKPTAPSGQTSLLSNF